MRPSFVPRLINGPFNDPGLFVPLSFRKQALLFDLGDLSSLSPGDLLKTSHIFVSHTHMDHFIGFDHIVRLLLGRAVNLSLYGPTGFLDNINGKLKAYTWNLVQNYKEALTLTATEIRADQRITQVFDCRKCFVPDDPVVRHTPDMVIYEEPGIKVSATILDHRIECLAFAVEERFHVNILKTELAKLGLATGPWLRDFKEQLYQKVDPATEFRVPAGTRQCEIRVFRLGALAEKIARITPGQKFAYVTDAVYCEENQRKIISLARGADHLFIEAAFLQADRATALEKYHLTAHQAGILAHKAKVRAMTVFHHSPRYLDRGHLLAQEARRAFESGG